MLLTKVDLACACNSGDEFIISVLDIVAKLPDAMSYGIDHTITLLRMGDAKAAKTCGLNEFYKFCWKARVSVPLTNPILFLALARYSLFEMGARVMDYPERVN